MKLKSIILILFILCLSSYACASQIDGGGSIDNAMNVVTGEQYIGSMGDADEEWFAFVADEGPAYYRADYKNEDINTTLYMTAYDSAGIKIAETDASKERNSYLSWKIVPGETYYLKFNRYNHDSNGRFTLSLTRTPDDYANEMEGAGILSLDQMVLTSFDGSGDTDFMTFTAEEGQAYYRADFKNETVDTTVYMTLLDEYGLEIAENDASRERGAYLSWLAEPGKKYYLQFSRYDKNRGGNYTVSLSRTADKEGQDIQTAIELPLDQQQGASFDGSGDMDFMTFTAGEETAYYRAEFKNETVDTTVYMTLLDENNLKMAECDASKERSAYISWLAEAGKKYYLQFSRYDKNRGGNYTVSLSCTPDKEGQNLETAIDLSLDQQLGASFDGSGDTDFMTFAAEEGRAYYRVDFKNETTDTTVYMSLLDENGLKLADTDASRERSAYISWLAEPGKKYYLEFTRYDKNRNGDYTVLMSRTPDNEANDLSDAAEPAVNTRVNASFDGSGDIDVFKITAGEGDLYYSVPFTNESVDTTVYMTLLDENGYKISDADASMGYSSVLSWKAETSAVYYLRFERYSDKQNGAYTFTVNEIADNEPDALPTEVTTDIGETKSFVIGGADDVDWLMLAPVEVGSYATITISNAGSGYIDVALTDANGNKIQSNSVGSYDWTITHYQLPGSALYLCVTGDRTTSYTVNHTTVPDIGGSSPEDAVQLAAGEKFDMIFEMDDDIDYAAFLAANANILITASDDAYIYAGIVDAYGQQLTDEYRLYGGDSCLMTSDRADAYLRLQGYGSCSLIACAPDAHIPTGTWITAREAACTEDGEQVMLCTVCGQYAESQAIPAAGHIPGNDYLTIKQAGCDDVGIEENLCKICAAPLERRNIPATGHLNTYWSVQIESGCETEGLQRRFCSDCGKQLEQERIPATGHFAGKKTQTQPTCEADGYTQSACQICGEVLEHEVLPAAGHVPGDMAVSIEAGCETDGVMESVCLTCGKVLQQEAIPATGHAFGEFVQVIAPTKNAEGLEESACANCDAVQSRPVEKLSFLGGLFN